MAGKDEWEKAKIIEIFDFYKDVYNELAPYIYAKWGIREGDVVRIFKINFPHFSLLFLGFWWLFLDF